MYTTIPKVKEDELEKTEKKEVVVVLNQLPASNYGCSSLSQPRSTLDRDRTTGSITTNHTSAIQTGPCGERESTSTLRDIFRCMVAIFTYF